MAAVLGEQHQCQSVAAGLGIHLRTTSSVIYLQRNIHVFPVVIAPPFVAGGLHVQVVMEMLQFPPPFPVPRRLVSEHFFHDHLQHNQCQSYRNVFFSAKISHIITISIHAIHV